MLTPLEAFVLTAAVVFYLVGFVYAFTSFWTIFSLLGKLRAGGWLLFAAAVILWPIVWTQFYLSVVFEDDGDEEGEA